MFRPRYHITAKGYLQNSMLTFYKEEYHVFFLTPQNYSNNEKSTYNSWGHMTSKNLIHWKEEELAIKPDKNYDKYGCWNGSLIVKDEIPYLFYTGINPETQCLAIGDKNLKKFNKYEQNPIIKNRPDELNITGFRDPYVWLDKDNKWKMILGCGIHGSFGTHYAGGGVLIYESDNLYAWQYKGIMFKRSIAEGGFYFETPNFSNLGALDILMVSPNAPVLFWLGNFKDNLFDSKTSAKRLDFGDCFYAASLFNDNRNNRTLLSGWVSEAIKLNKQKNNGCIALPKVVSLDKNNVLNIFPAPELINLRKDIIINERKIINSKKNNFNLFQSNTFEIRLHLLKNDSDKIIFNFCKSEEYNEYTSIIMNKKNSNFELNRSKSSFKNISDLSIIETSILHNNLIVHIYVDVSVIEIFLNYKKVITSRIYPNSNSKFLEIYSEGGNAEVDVKLWSIKDIGNVSV
jgi:beta-fructofuranosidase